MASREFAELTHIGLTLGFLAVGLAGCNPSVGSVEGCQSNEDCEKGWICESGTCLKLCNSETDCPAEAPECVTGTCRPNSDGRCDGEAQGTIRNRTRYKTATVAFSETCQAETQTQVCTDGMWTDWSGSFTASSCTVLPRVDCGMVIDGNLETRACYDALVVPAGDTCTFTEQTRKCRSGQFDPDWPPCEFTTCSVEGYASCEGGVPHGNSESRLCYAASSVPAGSTCSSVEQTRTCDNGVWSPAYPLCDHLSCTVEGYLSCGTTPHGGTESCGCYESASVPFGSECALTTEVRICNNGSWDPGCPVCTYPTCAVSPPASCDGQPHLTVQHRTRFQSASVGFGSTCLSEDQTRTCNNGTWSAWSGSYTHESCIEDALGLVYYFKCESLNGTQVFEEVSEDDGAGSRNISVTSSGKIGNGFGLNGDAHFGLHDGFGFLDTVSGPPFTVSAWFFMSSLPSSLGHDSYVFGSTSDSPPWIPVSGRIRYSDNRAVFMIYDTNGVEYSVESVNALSTGVWYHIAFVGEDDGRMKIFINGGDVTSSSVSFTGTFLELNGAENYGAAWWDSHLGIVGSIDEISLYDRALSPARISSLYNAGNGKTFPF